jgi:hypothetical protein
VPMFGSVETEQVIQHVVVGRAIKNGHLFKIPIWT